MLLREGVVYFIMFHILFEKKLDIWHYTVYISQFAVCPSVVCGLVKTWPFYTHMLFLDARLSCILNKESQCL